MAATDPSGTYAATSARRPMRGYIAVLALFANNNAEQTTIYLTKGAVSEVGVWAEEVDSSITVTMTGTLEQGTTSRHPSPICATATCWSMAFVFFKLDEITPEMMGALTALNRLRRVQVRHAAGRRQPRTRHHADAPGRRQPDHVDGLPQRPTAH